MLHGDGAVDIGGRRCVYAVKYWRGMNGLVEGVQVGDRFQYLDHDLGAEGFYRSHGHTGRMVQRSLCEEMRFQQMMRSERSGIRSVRSKILAVRKARSKEGFVK